MFLPPARGLLPPPPRPFFFSFFFTKPSLFFFSPLFCVTENATRRWRPPFFPTLVCVWRVCVWRGRKTKRGKRRVALTLCADALSAHVASPSSLSHATMATRKQRFVASAPTGEVCVCVCVVWGERGERACSALPHHAVVCVRGGERGWPSARAIAHTAACWRVMTRPRHESARRQQGAPLPTNALPPFCPQDPNLPASDLVTRGAKSCGWQSPRCVCVCERVSKERKRERIVTPHPTKPLSPHPTPQQPLHLPPAPGTGSAGRPRPRGHPAAAGPRSQDRDTG